ncbi:MAG: hypothetical protein ACJ76H_13840 [Bacteriovoracaceae bacterium]
MKSIVLNIVILLIAFMALDFDVPASQSDFSSDHQIAKIPQLDIDPLRNPTSRENSSKLNYIAEPFFPIVILAHSLYDDRDISFYLPVYELHHQNHFFLLI